MNSSYGDSWEEQAFAEDAAGTLVGGCVWPPRSYSCSFCRREFRSAQALGGHMNVHRRDRARLKQSPIIPSTDHHVVVPHENHHALNTCTSQICTFLYNKYPNPAHDHQFPDTRVSSSPAPAPATKVMSLNPPSWSSFVEVAEKRYRVLSPNRNEEKKFKAIVEQEYSVPARADHEKEDCVTEDLPAVSLKLVVCRTRTNTSSSNHEEVASNCKRIRRIEEEKPASSFRPNVVYQSEVLKFGPGPAEELDLELRLGNASSKGEVKLKL